MLCTSILLRLLTYVVALDAIAIPPHHVIHEKRETLHPRWKKRDRVESHTLLPMRIGLTQANLENGYEHILDISDPASPNFGKHWTSEDVIETFRPSEQTEREVREWLIENGIPGKRITRSDNKAWFAFYATAEEAERLLYTEYHEYEDSVSGEIIPACEAYHVPKNIRKQIDYITPGIKLLAPIESHKSKRSTTLAKKEFSTRKTHDLLKLVEQIKAEPNDFSTCDIIITPACIAALYKIPKGHFHNHNNSMGIFESSMQFYVQKDLDSFFTNFTTNIRNGTHPIPANIDGGQQSTDDLYYNPGEVSLDLMIAYPIVHPQKITLYQVGDFVAQTNKDYYHHPAGFNSFLDALDGSYCTFSAYNDTGDDPDRDQQYPDFAPGGWEGSLMCGVYKPTNVISISYGGQESFLPISYQKRQCHEYMKLGLQGVSFLFASGDSGVSDYPGSVGGKSGPTGCLGQKLNIFNPRWPVGCPYITTVGATKVYPGKTVYDPESAVFDPAGHPYHVNYSSGGGFSNVYPIPDYQKNAVATFFENYDPPFPYYSALANYDGNNQTLPDVPALAGSSGGIYNRIGRGIPDVAANGDNIAVYVDGEFGLSGGTSASAPIFAAIVNRINEERLNAGKGPIGFLNPSLYANPDMLNDITNGTNQGCNAIAFSAVPGWDPVTGLGTPNFPKMLNYYMSLP